METPSKIHYQNCPVCEGKNIELALSAKDYTVSSEVFDIWHCANCQTRFTQDVPSEDKIGAYYQSEDYISHSNTNKGLVNKIYQIVRRYTLGRKLKLVQKVSNLKEASILDYGCGTGEFLATMKEASWKTMGLEPDEGARKQALENHGLNVRQPDELFKLPPESFDVVSMWHVLEHVHRLHEVLSAMHRILKPGGTLIIAVPNYQSLDAEKYREFWAAYDTPIHLYHFSPNSLKTLLPQHKFELTSKKLMPFDAFYVSMLSEKYKHGSNRLFAAFWAGFRSWLVSNRDVNRSSSVIYISKKTN